MPALEGYVAIFVLCLSSGLFSLRSDMPYILHIWNNYNNHTGSECLFLAQGNKYCISTSVWFFGY